jgi:biopolymer transport protein ExbB
MRTKPFLFLLSLGLAALASAQTLQTARESAEADLRAALERYAALQERIKEEKIPLNQELNGLNAELRETRREATRSRNLRDNSSVSLDRIRDRVAKRKEQIEFVANMVTDLGGRFERDIDLSETQLYGEAIEAFNASVNRLTEEGEFTKGEKLVEQVDILATIIGRFSTLAGGHTYDGQAVVSGGDVERGTFVAVGPTYYFASTESDFAGFALKSNTSTLPPTAELGDTFKRGIIQLARTGEARVAVDPTLGSALAIAAEAENFWDWSHLEKGGVWIFPILAFAALATLTSLFKIFEIFSVKMPPVGALHGILQALNEGDREKALGLARAVPGPCRAMLVDAVEHADESKEMIEEVMYERMLEVQPRLERMLPFIAVTAATAPLMGLLGTVTGMINTFKLITIFGTGDAKQLSSGISEALITTEWGLIVAIPALVMHALLNRRVQGILARMERMAVAFVNGINRRA